MMRNWKLGEVSWEDRGVGGGGGYRYVPLVATHHKGGAPHEYHVAKIYIDEDDHEMLEDARLLAAAPLLLSIVAGVAAQLREMLAGTAPEPNEAGWRDILGDCQRALDTARGGGGDMSQPEGYANVVWQPEDVQTLRPNWSIERCEEWLQQNEKYIRDRTIELGWEVIETLLGGEE